MQGHLAAGGKTGITWWHAPVAVVGGYLIFFLAVIATFLLARLGPILIFDRMNRCVTMTRTIAMRELVCFGKGTTEREARELGEALLRRNVFQGNRDQRVDVERTSVMPGAICPQVSRQSTSHASAS